MLLFAQIVQANRYSIVVEDIDYLPEYGRQGNQYVGVGPDILRAFAKEQGLEFVFVALPLQRQLHTFVTGQADFKYPDHPDWDPQKKSQLSIIYSEPVVDFIDGVMTLPENAASKDFVLATLATPLGFTAVDYLQPIEQNEIELVTKKSLTQLLDMAINARVDGVYVNIDVAKHNLKQNKQINALVFAQHLPHTRSGYTLSTLNNPEVIAQLNQYLSDNRRQIALIKKRYGVD